LDDLHNIFISVSTDFAQSLRHKVWQGTLGGYSTVHRGSRTRCLTAEKIAKVSALSFPALKGRGLTRILVNG
jgi:hypothetical protein